MDSSAILQQGLTPIHDVEMYLDIEKSASDKRSYQGLKLPNGLKVMLISDPSTDKAAASLDVNVGSLSDPDELPGLAHFCEHMLFMGTEKYPEEDEYSQFVSKNSGIYNAYTSGSHTNYHFDIKKEKLEEVLDRFSQFFISPLFSPSCSDREVLAVNSEHEKNVMSDGWRLNSIEKCTSDPNHAYSKFGTGNKQTLDTIPKEKGKCIRTELLQFHKKFYSSNIMAVCILGCEPLDDLKTMAVDKFSSIENKSISPAVYSSSPFRAEDLQKCIKVLPVKDVRNLIIKFPIADYTNDYKCSPGRYLAHLIGHEGPGSLLSSLKSLSWASELSAGPGGGAKGYDFFGIYIEVTQLGLNHIDDIVKLVFQYIKLLKQAGPQEWIFDEIKALNNMEFRFKDTKRPLNTVVSISSAMHLYPIDEVLTAEQIISDFRPDLISELLNSITPKNMRLTIVSKSLGEETTNEEKWYGAKYGLSSIDKALISEWQDADINPEHHLPEPNDFISSNFSLLVDANCQDASPAISFRTDLLRVWFKQDVRFKLPKACLKFELFSLEKNKDAKSAAMVSIFVELFKDALNEYSYSAELAGLNYSLHKTNYGIEVSLQGYNEKLFVLMEKVFTKMVEFQVDESRFSIIKEKYSRTLQNFFTEQPYQHAMYYSSAVKTDRVQLVSDLIASLDGITAQDVQDFVKRFLSELHIDALMHGNLTDNCVQNACNLICEIFAPITSPLDLALKIRNHEMHLPDKSSHVFKNHHKVQSISATEVYLQIGNENINENMLNKLLAQIASVPFFDQLRTKETLGYIVFSSSYFSYGVGGLRLLSQSDRSPDYLDGRIESFLCELSNILDRLSDTEFEEHKSGLTAKILEEPKELATEAGRHWMEIISERLCFERPKLEANHLSTLTKNDVVKFYEKYISYEAPCRSKLATYIVGNHLDGCGIDPGAVQDTSNDALLKCPTLQEAVLINDIDEFKSTLDVYPRTNAYANPSKVDIQSNLTHIETV